MSISGTPSDYPPSTMVLSSDTEDIGAKQQYHTNVNQEGKRAEFYRILHWKNALAVRGSPRPFPEKETGTGARTQAPF